MNQIYIFNFISKFFHTDMVLHVYTQKTYLILYNTRTTQVKLSFTTQFYEIKSILFIYCTRNFKLNVEGIRRNVFMSGNQTRAHARDF